MLVEVLGETALQRELDEEVFTRAYGIALPVSLAGIVGGSLVAAPLAHGVGSDRRDRRHGVLAAGYAGVVVLPRRAVGRHRRLRPPWRSCPRRLAALSR